jgi:hypothetical protein
MTSVDYFEIDDKEYMITNEIEDNNLIYYFLANLDEKEDILIRKTQKENPTILYPLDDVDEVEHAIGLLEKIMIEEFAS